jgi:DNA-binding beta-propeller fold protein YncE
MHTPNRSLAILGAALLAASQAAYAQGNLAQTIDLSQWGGTPVAIVQPPMPAPAPCCSLTSIAFNPSNHTLYVADYATTNVYAIDTATNAVQSAVYTNGLFTNVDLGPGQNLPGSAPKTVLVNPATNRWIYMGQAGGAQFNGTTYVEGVNARSFQNGGSWDPVTDNVYGSDGIVSLAINNLKILAVVASPSNGSAVNPLTTRVYVASGSGLIIFDGRVLSQANVKIPTPPLGSVMLSSQVNGLAVNANTNRVYVAHSASLDVLDASTYQVLASVPLPDQSGMCMIAGANCMPLPRPVAINTLTNTVFVVNSPSSTVSVFDGNTNTVTGTLSVPVPAGAVVSQPLAAGTLLSEIKPGNTYYNVATGMMTSLGGAIAAAVNEQSNLLYVAGVNGTVNVFAMNPSAAAPAFAVSGTIRDQQGVPLAGIRVSAGGSTAVTDATGLFVLTGLTSGTYAVTPASPAYSFSPASQMVTVIDRNTSDLSFQANPPIVPASYTISPWTLIGGGVTTTGTVTLNQPAPAGGAVVALSASDPKAAKVPSTVTVPAGQTSVSFAVQGSGVSVTTTVALMAKYNGGIASATLTVAPGDKVTITSATFSQSTHTLTVNATGSNSQATLNVYLASNNQLLGTMVAIGNGGYTLQVPFVGGTPSSVNVVSNLGAKTGQGVTVTP